MDSIYMWDGRFITKEQIDKEFDRFDKEFDRLVNPEKYRRKEIKKQIPQILAGSLIGGAIAVLLILGLAKYTELPAKISQIRKTMNTTPQTTNPVATAAYNKELQKTL